MIGSFLIQGLTVNLHCEGFLFCVLSDYFKSLTQGNICSNIETVNLDLKLCKVSPPLPSDAVKEIKGPSITYYIGKEKFYFHSKNGSLISLDPVRREAKGLLTYEMLRKPSEFFMFITEPLAEMLKYAGLYFLHSAALVGNGISVLLSGTSGCGKTTSTLSLVVNGFQYVSDDTLLIKKVDKDVNVYPLYKSLNIDQDIAGRFPKIFKYKKNHFPKELKIPIDISGKMPGSHIQSARPDAIIFPKIISDSKSELRPIGRLEVYKRLLGQTILAIDRKIAKEQLNVLELLVKQTDGFELLSGKDLYKNPGSLIYFIEQIKK
jgi:hypothetical protein